MPLEAFSEEHLDAAAALLEERQHRHREAEPLLPAQADFRAEVQALWTKDGASGAFCEDGYVLGTRLDDETWGPNAWIELAGHAVREAELVRDLYAAAAAGWAEEGRTSQYVYVPAHDTDLVDAWFRLGFGAQQAFGIRELPEETAAVDGVAVRPAQERDVEDLVRLAPTLHDYQVLSPVFFRPQKIDDAENRAEALEDIANPDIGNLVAEVDGRIVGNLYVVPIELSPAHHGWAEPKGFAHIGWAAVLPEARGSGAGLALTHAAFAWGRERGCNGIVADWRVTNLLASRFWPKRGFRITFLRLHRAIA